MSIGWRDDTPRKYISNMDKICENCISGGMDPPDKAIGKCGACQMYLCKWCKDDHRIECSWFEVFK